MNLFMCRFNISLNDILKSTKYEKIVKSSQFVLAPRKRGSRYHLEPSVKNSLLF